MWFENCVFYQLYPLNFVDAPKNNDGVITHRLDRIIDYIPYLEGLGVGAVYFNPVFSSDTHGYDTRDYNKIDERLGTNEDMLKLVQCCHQHHIKVVLDGVFNHVGRGFIPFLDVKKNKMSSQYKDFFKIDFNGNSNYDDGFYYQGWEGHYELVELNLENDQLQDYLFDAVSHWINDWDIDGIRLDVAYSLPRWFMAKLKDHCRGLKNDFFLLGEVLGDNAGYMFDEAHLDSITDYPQFKAIWSSLNSINMFELAHTIKRNYMEMYKNHTLFSFVDNHDVERIASKLEDKDKIIIAFSLLLTLPGIPCIYYGSEWGIEGKKQQGSDDSLRPAINKPVENKLSKQVKELISIRNNHSSLNNGNFEQVSLTNSLFAYIRMNNEESILIVINISDESVYYSYDCIGENLLTHQELSMQDLEIKPKSYNIYLLK